MSQNRFLDAFPYKLCNQDIPVWNNNRIVILYSYLTDEQRLYIETNERCSLRFGKTA
jgi:hypothetical protein